ncbi:MAG: hypothetical protein Q7T51_01820 [Candidatus Moranbacteria bacterium]|nr:hypothetical protein [Candidatus Moranbacteria bacterium]
MSEAIEQYSLLQKLNLHKSRFLIFVVFAEFVILRSLAQFEFFANFIVTFIALMPLVLIIGFALWMYLKDKQDHAMYVLMQKNDVFLKNFLKISLAFLILFIVFFPSEWKPVFFLIYPLFHFVTSLSLDDAFIIMAYIGVLTVTGSLVLFFVRLYQKGIGEYQDSISHLTKKILYSAFLVFFLLFSFSAFAYPQAYAPIGEAIASVFSSNDDSTQQASLTGLLGKAIRDTKSNLFKEISSSNSNLSADLSTVKEDFSQSIDKASTQLATDVKTKLSNTGGEVSGALVLSGDKADLTVEGTTTTKDIIPDNNLSYNLGNSDKSWNTIYTHRLIGASPIFIGENNSNHGLTNTGDLVISHDAEVQGTLHTQTIIIAGAYTLPAVDGNPNQVMTTDGDGNLSWASVNAVPGGSIGQLQFNNAGTFGADASLFWDNASKQFGIGTSSPTEALHIAGNMRLENGLFDSTNSNGTDGMFLSSTGTDTKWEYAKGEGKVYRLDPSLTSPSNPYIAYSNGEDTIEIISGYHESYNSYESNDPAFGGISAFIFLPSDRNTPAIATTTSNGNTAQEIEATIPYTHRIKIVGSRDTFNSAERLILTFGNDGSIGGGRSLSGLYEDTNGFDGAVIIQNPIRNAITVTYDGPDSDYGQWQYDYPFAFFAYENGDGWGNDPSLNSSGWMTRYSLSEAQYNAVSGLGYNNNFYYGDGSYINTEIGKNGNGFYLNYNDPNDNIDGNAFNVQGNGWGLGTFEYSGNYAAPVLSLVSYNAGNSNNAPLITGISYSITSNNLIGLTQSNSAFSGDGINMNFGGGSGSFTGDFLDFNNGNVGVNPKVFQVSSSGDTYINSAGSYALRATDANLMEGNGIIESIVSYGNTAYYAQLGADVPAMYVYDTASASNNTFNTYHSTSAKTGDLINANMAVGTGSFTGDFLDFRKNNVASFTVGHSGELRITPNTDTGSDPLYVTDGGFTTDDSTVAYLYATGGNDDLKLYQQDNNRFIFGYDYGSTTANSLYFIHNTSAKSGDLINANMAVGTGSFTGDFLDFNVNSDSVFKVRNDGGVEINDSAGNVGVWVTESGGAPAFYATITGAGYGLYIDDSDSTSDESIYVSHNTSDKTADLFHADMASGTGSFTGDFLDFNVNSVNKFKVGATGQALASDGFIQKTNAGACTDLTFTTATDGLTCLDTTLGTERLYFRTGGTWSYIAKTGGFQIPNYEVAPLNQLSKNTLKGVTPNELTHFQNYLTQQITPGELLIPYADSTLQDGAIHGLYARFADVKNQMFQEEKTQIENLNLQLTGNISTVTDLKNSVNTQLGSIEKNLTTITNNQDTFTKQVANINTQINAQTQSIASLQALTDILQQQITALQSQIATPVNIAQIDANTQSIDYLNQLLGITDTSKAGDITIVGKLTSQITETGLLTIAVNDKTAATIGEAVIVADKSVVVVKTSAVSADSKIYITPIGSTDNQVIYVKNTDIGKGFEVGVDRLDAILAPKEINFNWWIVAEK